MLISLKKKEESGFFKLLGLMRVPIKKSFVIFYQIIIINNNLKIKKKSAYDTRIA